MKTILIQFLAIIFISGLPGFARAQDSVTYPENLQNKIIAPWLTLLLTGDSGNGGVGSNCGVIGDSIGAATHTNDSCHRFPGEHRELMDCLELRLGSHDIDWSFTGGTKSWSIANRLGCQEVYNTSKDGDEWKDAYDQARDQVANGQVGKVIVHLGANDVCAKYGHDFGSLAFVQPTTAANIVSIEAEHFIQRSAGTTHRWEPDTSAGASVSAVRAIPVDGTAISFPGYLTESPRLDFRVHFVKTGVHRLWIRGYASSPDEDLVHIGLDGQRQENAENLKIAQYNEWAWTQSTQAGLEAFINVDFAGEHTLNVYMGKDGLRLDKIVLVSDSSWIPAATGPEESARGIFGQEDSSGHDLVAIEAEHFHGQHQPGIHKWKPDYQPGFAAGAALRALPDNGTEFVELHLAPRLDYNVDFGLPGTYYVWVRGYSADENDDSVNVGVDGTSYGTAERITFNTHNTWEWSGRSFDNSVATIEIPSAGIHTVNLWMHKDGLRVDKIVLSASPAFQPSDSGPEEQWENDLGRIAAHIDDTMMYLTENLPHRGKIYWSGIVDLTKFRDMMVGRKHDHAFRKCQNLWDMDVREGTLQGDAKNSLCLGELGEICDWLPNWLEDELLGIYLDQFKDDFKDSRPCGRVLDSRNTQASLAEARRFNKALNDLMEQKAAQYRERKGVGINFTQKLWYSTDEYAPYFVSRLDCYHPNRTGQLKLAQLVWQGHNAGYTPTEAFYFEGFDSEDWCAQEFTQWSSCWYEGGWGDCGDEFICKNGDGGWFKFGKETSNNEDHWIARDIGDLSNKENVWLYFKHKRDAFDDDRMDWVAFYVWNGAAWIRLEKFKKNNDAGNHCSAYYDLTPYKDAESLKIRFKTNNSSDMKNGDKLMMDDITVFAW